MFSYFRRTNTQTLVGQIKGNLLHGNVLISLTFGTGRGGTGHGVAVVYVSDPSKD